ncbi:hypothetical protein [Thalassomonas sp. RHCl1]|uniref:hypothetical protein n=1 Tax=Thalassomonas sp. RHCl1 TaxID=2995320 RepID=UPI00248CB74B|nr:hypothetical protein [Thalassomonas sp. RHCl1]
MINTNSYYGHNAKYSASVKIWQRRHRQMPALPQYHFSLFCAAKTPQGHLSSALKNTPDKYHHGDYPPFLHLIL